MEKLSEIKRRKFIGRALDILSAALHRGEKLSRAELIRRTLATSPSGYYINIDYASAVLRIMRHRGVVPDKETKTSRGLWMELYAQVVEQMECRQMSFTRALTFVLNFKRPSQWYITPESAARLLRGVLEERRYVVPKTEV